MTWIRKAWAFLRSGLRKPVDSEDALRNDQAERLARQARNLKTGLPPGQFEDRPRR